MGAKLSDIYKERIDRYIAEYDKLSFSNNFNKKIEEIIDTAINISSNTTSVDKYAQCIVCCQSSANTHAHKRENCAPYEEMFDHIVMSLSFEQIIGSDIWNWKAIERTSVYLPIWNARETWNQLSPFTSQLKEPVRIISKAEQYWTFLIDQYEQNKLELMKLPTLFTKTTVVNYLPDVNEIQNLKAIFDKYDQEEQPSAFSKLQRNDQRVESRGYYLFDITTKNKYIDKNDFYLPITSPPSEIPSERCSSCQKNFSLFTRHYYCRMCGKHHCTDCLTHKRIPHLGYITKPVQICHKCSDEKKQFIYQHLFIYVKGLIESNRIEFLNIYLTLLHQYKSDGNEPFYRQSGEYFYQAEQYSLALQCFTYAKLDSDDWLQYSTKFCKKGEYSYSFTCMKLCSKPEKFWLEQATSQDGLTFALLCYERAKSSVERLFQIASRQILDDINTCLFYLLYLNIKYAGQINWKEFGEQTLLSTNYDGSLAMFCFHLYGKMQSANWNHIAEQLSNSNQFEKLAYLLSYLYHVQRIDFRTSQNSYIYFLTKIILSGGSTIPLDNWLNDICDTAEFHIGHIVIGLSISHIYRYTSWIEYKNHFIERREYYKALICHKMAEHLTQSNETRWFINAIEDLDPIGYELFNGTNRSSDWKRLGDQYFEAEKFTIALNCYLFCEERQVDQIIIQQAQSPKISLSTALLYYTVVYKRTRRNNSKVNDRTEIYTICSLFFKGLVQE